MSYIDAYHDKQKDEIVVAERVNGKRVTRVYPAIYRAYYEDPKGRYTSIFGDRLSKIETRKGHAFKKNLWKVRDKKLFESDINMVFRCLEENYLGQESPNLNIGFFDIETDFNPELGFADPWNPFAKVTAIGLHHGGIDKLIALVLKPEGMGYEEAEQIVNKFEDTILFDDEAELLNAFLELIDDIDVLSGWNSTGFDIPYLVNRIEKVLGRGQSKRFCLWGCAPRKRAYMKFGREMYTYDLTGRVHMDYLELYMKHNPQQLHSYRLDFVGEIEVGENKVPYDGTFDQLYNEDFEKFIAYNRQDVALLVKIDKKRKFIDLANQIAHTNAVQLQTTMGSVALIEQAITIEAHSQGLIVPNRKKKDWKEEDDRITVELTDEDDDVEEKEEDSKAAVGAYVAVPKKGLHDYIGAVDINSLYPSTIRALNISTETLFGQIRLDRTYAEIEDRIKNRGVKKSDAWEGIFAALEYDMVINRTDDLLTVDLEDGSTIQLTGAQLYDYIFDPKNKLVISANGTLFRRDRDGIIPALLGKWYAQRKEMQGKEKKFGGMAHGADVKDKAFLARLAAVLPTVCTADTPEYDAKKLVKLVEAQDIDAIVAFAATNNLFLEGEVIRPTDKSRKEWKALETFWNMRQQARKILLNSLYGALLNEACKFYDQRMGQSVTLTGRSISRHMNSMVNYEFTGIVDYKGDAVIYADTDSSYFSCIPVMDSEFFRTTYPNFVVTKESIIELYDAAAERVNQTFPPFMDKAFNTTLEKGKIIAAGREIVALKGLFIKKKKYACLLYDKDGERLDVNGKPGKIKAMGLDLKRADTPKMMQKFLNEVLMDLLTGHTKDEIFGKILNFRRDFKRLPSWDKGTPRKVNGLTKYREKAESIFAETNALKLKIKDKKMTIPGHVDASLNWNKLVKMNHDTYSTIISDGAKVIVCKLKPGPLKMKAVAYPIDQMHLPEWFKEMSFDDDGMENVIIDKKLNNLVAVLGWDLTESRDDNYADDFFVWD